MSRKVGFLIHHYLILDHFLPVAHQLEEGLVDLIVEDRPESMYGNQVPLVEEIVKDHFNIVPLSVALSEGLRWKLCVSNHGYSKGLMPSLGLVAVRQMYGLDNAPWNFGKINKIFDVAMTHGRFDSEVLLRKFGTKSHIMGYPKQAQGRAGFRLSQAAENRSSSNEHAKPRVVWLPTMHEANSILSFSYEVSSLSRDFEVLVRPHPMTYEQHPHQITALEKAGCKIVPPGGESVQALIAASQFSLHDWGSTAAAAIYAGKIPIFLGQQEGAEGDEMMSPEVIARNLLGAVKEGDLRMQLEEYLQNSFLMQEKLETVARLRGAFFVDFGGEDAKIAASILAKILEQPVWVSKFFASRMVRLVRRAKANLSSSGPITELGLRHIKL